MAEESPETRSTRERLLEAAGRLFADKGFAEATVAEICRGAEANIAAVNYYFGGKENLYQEAWRHAHAKAMQLSPPDGGVPAEAPAEQRLRGRIRGILQRAITADGVEFRIMGQEIAKPTGLLARIVEEAIRPMRQATEAILLDLLGHREGGGGQSRIDSLILRLCEISIIAPCLMIVRRRHYHGSDGLEGKPHARSPIGPELTAETLEMMVEHFTRFALGGVAAVNDELTKQSES